MDFSGKQVVVSGGTGALGTAVVSKLLAGGATCIIPYVHEAEVQRFPNRSDAKSRWVQSLRQRRPDNVAAVALAAKHARISWALLARGKDYEVAV